MLPSFAQSRSLGGAHGAMLHGFSDLLGGARGFAVRPSVVTQTSRPYCVARFSLSSSCSYCEAPSSDRSSSSLVPAGLISGPKSWCSLVLRVQAVAHGQEHCECQKLKPLLRQSDSQTHISSGKRGNRRSPGTQVSDFPTNQAQLVFWSPFWGTFRRARCL